jgi:hypothetical protein
MLKKEYHLATHKSGDSKIYSFNIVEEYENYIPLSDNQSKNQSNKCLVRYEIETVVKNYGFWRKNDIKFQVYFIFNMFVLNDIKRESFI